MAAEDLAEAGAERAAAVAMEQAAFAALRPQGRPLVRVQAAGPAALEPTGTTMDIVTDDMPYLVDSVLIAVHRCGLEVHEVIHPQLRVIRDVGGTMHGVLGVSDGSPATHDEMKESWIHLETSTLSGPGEAAELGADLERVLGDVRAAVEDYPKMHARALTLADTLARTAPPVADEAETTAETEALLRWLADGHFTFLGYREYDLVDGADGMQLHAVPGTGLGILRHDRPASSAFAALPPEVRAKATEPRLLIVDQGQLDVHRAPAALPGLHRGQAIRPGRQGDRRAAVPRPVHALGVLREHHPDPGAAPQAGRGAGRHRPEPRTATTATTWPSSWRTTRARSCSRSRCRS